MARWNHKAALIAAMIAGIAIGASTVESALGAGTERIAVEIVNGVRPLPKVLVGAFVNGVWMGEVRLGYHQGPSPGLVVRKGDRVRIYVHWGRQYDEVTFRAQKKPERVQPKLDARGRLYLLRS